MQLKFLKTCVPGSDKLARVSSVSWSPNNRRLAVADANRLVQLFDETGEKKDKFATKPADGKGPKSYVVRSLAFSPDSAKLAIAQSDNIVFVYKLGTEWGDKKSICNKFINSNPVCDVTWPSEHPNELVYTTADGKIKIGSLRNNKAATLFVGESYPVALTSGPDGHSVISAHMDGSLHRFTLDDPPVHAKFCHHPCVPTCVAWGRAVCVAGGDCRVCFYDPDSGNLEQVFDFPIGPDNEPLCMSANPSGTAIAVASMNRIRIFAFDAGSQSWILSTDRYVQNMLATSTMSWKLDGSRLAVATVTGQVDLYDCYLRRYRYKGRFEFTYVSPSQIIVKRLSTGARIVLKSHFGYEITKVNIYRDQYLVAHTPTTLLMGDLASCKLSEIPWNGSGNERFYLDNPAICMIYNAGELTLVEYGRNDVLGTIRTDYMSPHLISIQQPAEGIVYIASLIDRQTIRVVDIASGVGIATLAHDSKVDWLELNPSSTKLLFRDKRRALHLYDVEKQQKTTLLHYCGYVQWVPNADVVVAQNRNDLCVWYDIDAADRVTIVTIKGDVVDIERTDGTTEVIVDEGLSTVSYALDETLIEFGAAMRNGNYDLAADILSAQPLSPEIEAMWTKLATATVAAHHLLVAERCYAALGDASKSRFLRKTNFLATQDNWIATEARMSILRGDMQSAERLYLDHGMVHDAVGMLDEMHMFEEAIALVERQPALSGEAVQRKQAYLQWLVDTAQFDRAAAIKEREGKFIQAIQLYTQAGLLSRAANIIISKNLASHHPDLADRLAGQLEKASLYELGGRVYEALGAYERALDAYGRGACWRAAIDLARKEAPQLVVSLEEQWGDYLMNVTKQYDLAIGHYIEAGAHIKALEASIQARQLGRAAQILASVPANNEQVRKYIIVVAAHYADARNYKEAEKLYIRGGRADAAVQMYTKANMLDQAYKVASAHLSEEAAAQLYLTQAQGLEREGKLKDAEKIYIRIGEPDLAITMYKKAKRFDEMIRLVSTHRRELLLDTYLHLANQFEQDGYLAEAENYYCQGKDWKAAVVMYKRSDRWEDAYRVAKAQGGAQGALPVAAQWALALGHDAGGSLLQRLGLLSEALEYYAQTANWEFAFELTTQYARDRASGMHEKYAMALEDAGRFQEAEIEFCKAGKAREAIDMYCHLQDFASALRVAENHAPDAVPEVFVAQAKLSAERGDLAKAEALYIKAKRGDLAVKMYIDNSMPDVALPLAREYAPGMVPSIESILRPKTQSQRAQPAPAVQSMQIDQSQDEPEDDMMDDVPRTASRNVQPAAQQSKKPKGSESQSNQQQTSSSAADAAYEAYLRRGQFEEAVKAAAQLPNAGTHVAIVVMRWADHVLRNENDAAKAVAIIARNIRNMMIDPSNDEQLVHIWEDMVKPACFSTNPKNMTRKEVAEHARTVAQALAKAAGGHDDCDKWLHIAVLNYVACKSDEVNQLSRLAARSHASILRYALDLPVDRLFYDAGVACRKAQSLSSAFVFLNRFLDITEAMDEPDEPPYLENGEFEGSDIPFDFEIPERHCIDEQQREEARSWVLTVSLDPKVRQELATRQCDRCGHDVWEGNLKCSSCGTSHEACCVSGFPILGHAARVECSVCHAQADRDAWNEWVQNFKQCPCCLSAQMPSY